MESKKNLETMAKPKRKLFYIATLFGVCVYSCACYYYYFGPSSKSGLALVKELPSWAAHSRFYDFRRDWFRQHRARVDWKSMLKPCIDNTQWGVERKYWGKENRSSARTSQVVYTDIRPAGEFSKIFIQSKTADNRKKLIGGDSWRVHLSGPSSLGATVFDHENGTYEILFLIMEPGNYQVMIFLDFSLCDGLKEPPADWFIKGNADGKEQEEGTLDPISIDQYLLEPFNEGKPFNITVPNSTLAPRFIDELPYNAGSCTQTCNYLWDGFGRWANKRWRPYLEESFDWSLPKGYQRKGTLSVYGDSVSYIFGRWVLSRALCKTLYEGCIRSYQWIYPFIREHQDDDDDLDFRPEIVIENIRKVLTSSEMQREGSLMVLNNGLGSTISYQVFLAADLPSKAQFIEGIKNSFASLKYGEYFRIQVCSTRVALFSAFATSAMCNAGFDVVDVYPLSDASPDGAYDYAHYKPRVFWDLETLLEKYKTQNNEKLDDNKWKNALKRCIG
ncbi:PREDICTED: uncharacterized protein LOC107338414 [Acropora digitifera]|uniref:uncharacterized protein LOC107338414 n=1 Tax=Acropora digitifera TaxID=70779 RepID=UPI00077A2FBD|nr:PREDICTED: uncharacterized protein LOC107338414 [Acropora digitifera]